MKKQFYEKRLIFKVNLETKIPSAEMLGNVSIDKHMQSLSENMIRSGLKKDVQELLGLYNDSPYKNTMITQAFSEIALNPRIRMLFILKAGNSYNEIMGREFNQRQKYFSEKITEGEYIAHLEDSNKHYQKELETDENIFNIDQLLQKTP